MVIPYASMQDVKASDPQPRRRARPSRALPYKNLGGAFDQKDGRSLYCVDLRAVELAWAGRPLEEIRDASRGGRLSYLFGGLDLDPRRSIQRNARTLSPLLCQKIFDALCEELAEGVLYDVPRALWRLLLPLISPHGRGESPYPADGTMPDKDEGGGREGAQDGGLVILAEGRLCAEAAALALSRVSTRSDEDQLDRVLLLDVILAITPMLEAVRDQNRSLLIEA